MTARKIFSIKRQSVAQKRFEAFKMLEMLDEAYAAERREPHGRAKKSFAPSGIGYGPGKCPRRWFYDFTGGVVREEGFDSVGIANMSYGTEAHTRIQKLFERTDILVETEKKVISEDPPIFGFADLVVNWQGEEVVGEIKTTMQESYVSKQHKNQAAGYHILQVLIYMKVMGYNKGFLLYENKNTQELHIIPVTWNVANKKLADDTFEWMRTAYNSWQEGDKPARPYRKNSVICKQCPFKTHCWSDEETELDNKNGTVDLPELVVPQ